MTTTTTRPSASCRHPVAIRLRSIQNLLELTRPVYTSTLALLSHALAVYPRHAARTLSLAPSLTRALTALEHRPYDDLRSWDCHRQAGSLPTLVRCTVSLPSDGSCAPPRAQLAASPRAVCAALCRSQVGPKEGKRTHANLSLTRTSLGSVL